jgi:hypothetical protein
MSLPTPLVAPVDSPFQKKRTPNGVDKPIAVRLSPDERAEVERLSEEQRLSMAAVSRACIQRGLAAFKRDAALAKANELHG